MNSEDDESWRWRAVIFEFGPLSLPVGGSYYFTLQKTLIGRELTLARPAVYRGATAFLDPHCFDFTSAYISRGFW